MAWGVKKMELQRALFCQAFLSGKLNLSEACRQFDISRPTGYLWLKRYQEEGFPGLINRSTQRESQNNQTSQNKEDLIILLKSEFSHQGPKKIHAKLHERYPEEEWPGITTIHNILKRNGLVQSRKVKRRLAETNTDLYKSKYPNDVWCMDFKGWYMTKDNERFDPFTLTDHETRYLIRCNKLRENNKEHVWAILEMAFREYGLPLYIRSDNGPPFATSCPGRLSKLAVKLIKAGVTPEWIEPGNPQQNGRHERMHLTMEREGFVHGSNLKEQMKLIEEFINYYNFERPHEALGQKAPGSLYVPSTREWNGRFQEIEYSKDFKILKVRVCGNAAYKGGGIYISRVLAGENVGLRECEKGLGMYYGNIFLGIVDNDNRLVVERRPSRVRKQIVEG